MQFKTNEYGGTKQGLGLNDVKSVIVPLPDFDEQRAIICQLDVRLAKLVASIGCTEREIALMREYRRRLIADVVTGKLNVAEVTAGLADEIEALISGPETDLIGEDGNVDAADDVVTPEEAEA